MNVNVFRTGKTGSSTEYSERGRDWQNKKRPHEPMVLFGQAQETIAAAHYSLAKQLYVAGVFSSGVSVLRLFPEPWLEFMAWVLQYFCGGYPAREFGVTFIAHPEENLRTHVHFEVLTRHLPSGRSIPPYRHSHDGEALRLLCRLANLRWGMPDPDASPALIRPASHRLGPKNRTVYRQIVSAIKSAYEDKQIQNHADIMHFLRVRLGMRIIHEDYSHIVIKPYDDVPPFRLLGRIFEYIFTRSGFDEAVSTAKREQGRPIAERIEEARSRYAELLRTRYNRFTRILAEATPDHRPLTKGQRISQNRTTEACDRRGLYVLRRLRNDGPLPLDHYRFSLPARALAQLRTLEERVPREQGTQKQRGAALQNVARTNADVAGPKTKNLPVFPMPMKLVRRAHGNSESAEEDHKRPSRSKYQTQPDYESIIDRIHRQRKWLAAFLARLLAMQRLREAVQRIGDRSRECVRLAERCAELARGTAETGRSSVRAGRTMHRTLAGAQHDAQRRVETETIAQRTGGREQPVELAVKPLPDVGSRKAPRVEPLPAIADARPPVTPARIATRLEELFP